MAETYVRARISTDVKQEASEALKAMGLTMSEFLRIAVMRVAKEKTIPFEIKVPNATTLEAMAEAKALLANSKGRTAEQLFDELENQAH